MSSKPEENTKYCESLSQWSFCSGITINDYKGDDWCGCYASNKIALALAIDGISHSIVNSKDGKSAECLARGSIAARSVEKYYIETAVPFLEETFESTGRDNADLSALASILSPGLVGIGIEGNFLRKIIKLIKNKLIVFRGKGQSCLVGGQAVLSGTITLRNTAIAFIQAGDTGLTSSLCRVPLSDSSPEMLVQGVYTAMTTLYSPLPQHLRDGDPNIYADFNARFDCCRVNAKIALEPTVAIIPWKSMLNYRAKGYATWNISIAYSDGVNADLLLDLKSNKKELEIVLNSLHMAATKSGNPRAIRLLAEAIKYYAVMLDKAPLSISQILAGATCSAIITKSRIEIVKSIVESILRDQQLVAGRDDRTLVILGTLLG